MKTYIQTTASIAAGLIFGTTLIAGPTHAQDSSDIEAMFRDNIVVEVEPLDLPAEGVLSAPVFDLRYAMFTGEDEPPEFRGVTGAAHRAWIRDGKLVPIFGLGNITTDSELEEIDGLIDPGFRLDQDTARDFMDVLKAVMGRDQFDGVPVESIQNDGNNWYFINGDFLSYYKGFIVTVDDQGAVTDMQFRLSMLDQED